MNKSELVASIAGRTRLPASEVAVVVDAALEAIKGSVARGGKVVLSGFGTFGRRTRAPRTARDILAGRAVRVPATNVVVFKAGKPFKEAVAKARGRPRVAPSPAGRATARTTTGKR